MRDKKNDVARIGLMKEEIANIEEFVANTHSMEDFVSNKILCHAVVYNLQCIGENVYKLSREFVEEHPDMKWEAIEGLRHVLVHDYYNVSFGNIWRIVTTRIPQLKDYLDRIPSPEV